MYTEEDYKRPNGQMYHTYPSLKSREDQEELWAATDDGAIQAVATDEICCPLAVKTPGRRIDDTTGGNAGVEPRVALMYTEMVEKRGFALREFVDLVSANAAKIMGLYPRKGAIAAGPTPTSTARPAPAPHSARRGDARSRLQPVGRPRGRCLAGHDDPARQGRGRRRHLLRRPQGRPLPLPRDPGGDQAAAGAFILQR